MKIKTAIQFISALVILPILAGCLTLPVTPKGSYAGIKRQIADLKPEDFQREIEGIKRPPSEEATVSVRAKISLKQALLQLDHNNPSRNYHQALKALEKYVDMEPGGAQIDEVLNWIEALKELERLHNEEMNLKKERVLLQSENEKLNDEINSLLATIEKLRGDIDKLNKLDLELEKKRKINK